MNRILLWTVAAIVMASPFCKSASAWNSKGHMTIAILAYRQLSGPEKQVVDNILLKHPHYALFLSGNPTAGLSPAQQAEYVFARAATWPDFVRANVTHPHPAITKEYHHASWHYINLPYVMPGQEARFNVSALAPKTPNALTQLQECMTRLRDRAISPAERAVYLCWLLHLTGDVHQPLHCVMLFSKDHPQGDFGGNSLSIRPVAFNGEPENPMNLHAYWDDLLGNSIDPQDAEHKASDIASDPRHTPDKLKQLGLDDAKPENFNGWIGESFATAKTLAYLNGEIKSANSKDLEEHRIMLSDVPLLPIDYRKNALAAARTRVALAGHRLSVLVKAIAK